MQYLLIFTCLCVSLGPGFAQNHELGEELDDTQQLERLDQQQQKHQESSSSYAKPPPPSYATKNSYAKPPPPPPPTQPPSYAKPKYDPPPPPPPKYEPPPTRPPCPAATQPYAGPGCSVQSTQDYNGCTTYTLNCKSSYAQPSSYAKPSYSNGHRFLFRV